MKDKNEITASLKWAKLLLITGVLVILTVPFILTRSSLSTSLNFTQTGQIGDTIGGITTPFLSLIGATLLFLALRAQIKANELIQVQITLDRKDRTDDIETQNLNQLYSYLKDSIEGFQFTQLEGHYAAVTDGKPGALKGGEAFYRLFDIIKCEYHGSEEQLQTTQPISELTSILHVMTELLNNLIDSESKNKEILCTLVENLFNYKIMTRVRTDQEEELRLKYCESCKHEHGIPDELRYQIVGIRNRIAEVKRKIKQSLIEQE